MHTDDLDVQTSVRDNRETISFYASHLVLDGLERGLSLKQIGEAIDTNPVMRGLTSMDKYPGMPIDLELRMHDDAVYYLNRRGLCDAGGNVIADADMANPDAFFAQVVGVRITDSMPSFKKVKEVKLELKKLKDSGTPIDIRNLVSIVQDVYGISTDPAITNTRMTDAMIKSGFIDIFVKNNKIVLLDKIQPILEKMVGKKGMKFSTFLSRRISDPEVKMILKEMGSGRKLRHSLGIDITGHVIQFKEAIHEYIMEDIHKIEITDLFTGKPENIYSDVLLDEIEIYKGQTVNRDEVLGVVRDWEGNPVDLQIGVDYPRRHSGKGLEHIWVEHKNDIGNAWKITTPRQFVTLLLENVRNKPARESGAARIYRNVDFNGYTYHTLVIIVGTRDKGTIVTAYAPINPL